MTGIAFIGLLFQVEIIGEQSISVVHQLSLTSFACCSLPWLLTIAIRLPSFEFNWVVALDSITFPHSGKSRLLVHKDESKHREKMRSSFYEKM